MTDNFENFYKSDLIRLCKIKYRKKYGRVIDSHTLIEIMDSAILRAWNKYDPQKCTLSKFVNLNFRWACNAYLHRVTSETKILEYIPEYFEKLHPNYSNYDFLLDISDSDKAILIDRYIGNMSYTEIANKYLITRFAAKKRIERIISRLKQF